MIIDWTSESIVASACIILVFLLSAFWIKKGIRIVLLLIGFLGLWLAIVDPYLEVEKDMKTTEVLNISTFLISGEADQTDTVKLFGSDYDIEELALLSKYQIKHLEITEDFGISEISIPEVQEGLSFTVRGLVQGNSDLPKSLWLEGPDKQKFASNLEENGNFQIESIAPVKGLYEYKIFASLENGDTLSEIVPIEVLQTSKLSMLILGASPQFELNYLKNYWVSQGHAIVQKVKISQEKYNTSFVNMEKFQFTQVTRKTLDRFDILLVDIATWNGFAATERGRILKAVEERGLGVILKPTKGGESAKGLPRNSVSRFIEKEIGGTVVSFAEIEHSTTWLSVQNGLQFKKGFGNVLMLKPADSYRYILSDQKEKYQNLWGDVFSALYVKIDEGFKISTPFLIFQGERTEVQVGNVSQDAKLIHNDQNRLVINYTPFLDGYGEAKVVPEGGWNKISRENPEGSQWFYANDSQSWKSMRQTNVNRYIQKLTNKNNEFQTPESYYITKPLPFYISLLMMIFGFAAVWILEKLN